MADKKLILKRDANNKIIDPDESRRIVNDLTKKLITEQRAHEKDNSMHFAKTGKRDIVVHLAVTVLPTVNGVNIVGEVEKEYEQWCFKINARQLPMPRSYVIKAFSELAHMGKSAMIKLGMVRG